MRLLGSNSFQRERLLWNFLRHAGDITLCHAQHQISDATCSSGHAHLFHWHVLDLDRTANRIVPRVTPVPSIPNASVAASAGAPAALTLLRLRGRVRAEDSGLARIALMTAGNK